MINEQLRASAEEVRQRGVPFVGLESILLVDPDPRQLLTLARQLVTTPRQLLFFLEEREPSLQPFFTRPHFMLRHSSLPSIPECKVARSARNFANLTPSLGAWVTPAARRAGVLLFFLPTAPLHAPRSTRSLCADP